MIFQGSAKHEGPVAGLHLIGLAREVQKEAELVFYALQGSKEYFATLVRISPILGAAGSWLILWCRIGS